MRYGYYPGCSLGGLARPYNVSTKAIAEPLGIELKEIDDWNCCGATEYMAINKTAAYALIAQQTEQGVIFTYYDPAARDVQIAGDFSDWKHRYRARRD